MWRRECGCDSVTYWKLIQELSGTNKARNLSRMWGQNLTEALLAFVDFCLVIISEWPPMSHRFW